MPSASATAQSTTPANRRPLSVADEEVGETRPPSGVSTGGGLPESVTAPIPVIDAYLAECLGAAQLPENLTEAIGYSLLAPGKRVRPLLTWHACTAVGADPKESLPAAAAVELVHAFSLVHDDLPGLDNDDLRRGRPTLHKHTSEAMAILAGDAMLTLAFRVLVERSGAGGGGGGNRMSAGLLTGEIAGATSAMIAGQVYDTLGGLLNDLDGVGKLRTVHENKTGALIRAACRMGAISGLVSIGVDAECLEKDSRLEALTRYGEAVGLAFQIVDDLLDVTQSTDHLGKRSGKDHEAGKLTYPGVLGIEESRRQVRELEAAALAAIAGLAGVDAAEPLRDLCTYMAVRSK
ncbi:MAG: polyprenyl synthetase family protein [Phycisphaerales bacterium]|nr:polyprenyl synthetase family protein [Phycisphaerales bacterium]